MLTYGFRADSVIFHIHGDHTHMDADRSLKAIFADPRWKPGETKMLAAFCRRALSATLLERKYRMDLIASGRPKALATLVADRFAMDVAKELCALLKPMKIPCAVFTDLQELFDWIDAF